MSKTVDERVVSMQFDNKNFESNVQTSLSTLDKLKQSLNLTGASKGLENVSAAAKNVDMSTLGGAVESVRVKFSALEVMGITGYIIFDIELVCKLYKLGVQFLLLFVLVRLILYVKIFPKKVTVFFSYLSGSIHIII